jgi:hypothetical protein
MFYKILNLPKIPNNLVNFDQPVMRSGDMSQGRPYFKQGKQISSAYFTKIEASEQLKDWIVDLIPGVSKDMIYLQSLTNGGDTLLIHSDILRTFALNYIVDTGGDQVTTSWYQEKGHPLSRYKDPALHGLGQSDTKIVHYADCEVLEQVCFKKNQWTLIRTDVLHDVDHMTSTRSAVSIGILPQHQHIVEQLIGKQFDPEQSL